MVCKLNKTIYSLKQNPKAWFEKFSQIIITFSFQRCHVDHSVFIRKRAFMIIIVILFNKKCALYDHSSSDIEGINETKEYLKGRFVTKDLGHPILSWNRNFSQKNEYFLVSKKVCYTLVAKNLFTEC